MFALRNIEKSFNGQKILRDVTLEVAEGDVVAILGPSGSGKTTLLRIADFLETADKGTVVSDGETHDLAGIPPKVVAKLRRRAGFVFQNYALFANHTAIENVMLGLVHARGVDRKTARALAEKALGKVGLGDRLDHYPSQLSGGQQQRVAIARAMVYDPEVIFFDEPTSALDPELTGEVLNVIRDLAREGRTMVLVTHEMSFARKVANRIVFMENGLVVEEGTPEKLFTAPENERTRAFLAGHGGCD